MWGARARAGEVIDPAGTPPVPRYFMLNDRSGFRSLGRVRRRGRPPRRPTRTPCRPAPPARSTSATSARRRPGHRRHRTAHPARQPRRRRPPDALPRQPRVDAAPQRRRLPAPRRVAWTPRATPVLQQWEDVVELDPLDRKEIMLPSAGPRRRSTGSGTRATRTGSTRCTATRSRPRPRPAGSTRAGSWRTGRWPRPGPPGRTCTRRSPARRRSPRTSRTRAARPPSSARRPTRTFLRKFYNRRLRFPDGAEHEIWSFEDETSGRRFPAPLIRVTEGDVVHVQLEPSKRVHTIHHHGMEPDPRNDGVGHTSFEVTGSYTYQWRPDLGRAGRPEQRRRGAVLLPLPRQHGPARADGDVRPPSSSTPSSTPTSRCPPGARRSFVDGPLYDIATETLLVAVRPRPALAHLRARRRPVRRGRRSEPLRPDVLLRRRRTPQRPDAPPPTSRPRTSCARTSRGRAIPRCSGCSTRNYFPSRARFTDTSGSPSRWPS